MYLWLLQLLFMGLFVLYLTRSYFTRVPDNFPAGPSRIPIIGSILYLPKQFRIKSKGLHIPKVFHYLARKYGKVSGLYLGPLPTIVISDVKILREAFRHESLSARPLLRPFHEFRHGGPDGLQRGLVLSTGREWNDQRRFSLRQLRDLGFGKTSMEAAIAQEVGQLNQRLLKDVETGKPVDLSFKTNLSVINALWMILVGERLDLDDKRLLHIVKAIEAVLKSAQVASLVAILFPTIFKMFHPRFERARVAFEDAKVLMRSAINQHIEANKRADKGPANDFIDVYLEKVGQTVDETSSFYGEAGLKSLEIVLVDLFIGGSETTSTTLNWTVLYLLHHPQVQQEIHKELDSVVGRRRDSPPTLEDKPRLPYLNAVIYESLRMSSVVPSGVPHYVEKDTQVGDYFFPQGSNVMANISFIHHDPEIWTDPENFDPNRFITGDKTLVDNQEHLIPFSVGKRQCLGKILAEQEFYLFFSGLMHQFEFRAVPNAQLPGFKFYEDNANTGFIRYPPRYQVIICDRLKN